MASLLKFEGISIIGVPAFCLPSGDKKFNPNTFMEFYTDENGYYRFRHNHMLVHVWAAEKKLGRKLRIDEEVTHIDNNKLNNWPHNLQINQKPGYQKFRDIDKMDLAEILASMKHAR